jgi:hypothetical protein
MASELHEYWCAILGSNQRTSLINCGSRRRQPAGCLGTSRGPHVMRDGSRPARLCTLCADTTRPATCGDLRKRVTATSWGSSGRRFKSCQPDNEKHVLNCSDSLSPAADAGARGTSLGPYAQPSYSSRAPKRAQSAAKSAPERRLLLRRGLRCSKGGVSVAVLGHRHLRMAEMVGTDAGRQSLVVD